MNSVHEPGSRTMSKNLTPEKYRVKPGQKQAECTKCTALANPRTQAARPAPRPRAPRTPAVVRSLCPVPARPCPARQRPATCRARSRSPRSPSAQLRAQRPLLRLPNQHYLLQYTTIYCNTKKKKFHNITWAVAQKRFCTNNFFFFSIPLISNYWKNSEKIFIHFFFSFFQNTQIIS